MGLKETETAHFAPAARAALQVLAVMMNSPVLTLAVSGEVAEPPVLVTSNAIAVEVAPRLTLMKSALFGVMVNELIAVTLPVSMAVAIPPVMLLTVRVAVLGPAVAVEAVATATV